MKVTIHMHGDGGSHAARLPYSGADHVLADLACPACKAAAPIQVRGRGITSRDHDTYYADAEHQGCGALLGRMHTKVDTIFGVEEDERVLNGRARVY